MTIIIPVHEYNPLVDINLKGCLAKINESLIKPEQIVLVISPSIKSFVEQLESNVTLAILENTTGDYCYQSQINFAANNIQSNYFIIHEFDDIMSPNYISVIKDYISAYPDVDVFLPIIPNATPEGNIIYFGNIHLCSKGVTEKRALLDIASTLTNPNIELTGCVIKRDSFLKVGGLKSSLKLTFNYELLLRMLQIDYKIMVTNIAGYLHQVQRPNSLFESYKGMSEKEYKFWFDLAKKEYFFLNDRKIEYVSET